MVFKLLKPTYDMEPRYDDYIREWEDLGEKIVPFASKRNDKSYKDLVNEWEQLATEKAYNLGLVPGTLYFLIGESNNIYGALQIRHELNEYLLNYGGHIGYGVRPSERRKGYATKMLSLALEKVKELGIDKVLITCNKDNIASAKTIINNGGILENEVIEDGKIKQRYWIEV